MRHLRFLAFAFLVPTLAAAQGARRAPSPIIDMHMHAFRVMRGPDGLPLPVPCAPQPCQTAPAVATSDDSIFRLTVAAMDRYNIVKGFLSSDNLPDLYRWVEAAPGRFLPSPFVWRPGEPSIENLRREYAAGRLVAMGEIGSQYNGLSPADSTLEPYFALAEELDVPVHIHTLGFGAPLPGFRSAAGNPLLLEPVLVRHPRLRLFVEDAGYPFLGEMIAMMYQYPQLYADLATISWIIPRETFHDYLRALVRAGLGQRLMFGSDQMQWPETIGQAIDGIESATFLTAAQKRDILYNNAARFLRLVPTPVPTR